MKEVYVLSDAAKEAKFEMKQETYDNFFADIEEYSKEYKLSTDELRTSIKGYPVLAFHKKYYHPSNALICLDGDIDIENIMDTMNLDKKKLGNKLNVILLSKIGKSEIYKTTNEFFKK